MMTHEGYEKVKKDLDEMIAESNGRIKIIDGYTYSVNDDGEESLLSKFKIGDCVTVNAEGIESAEIDGIPSSGYSALYYVSEVDGSWDENIRICDEKGEFAGEFYESELEAFSGEFLRELPYKDSEQELDHHTFEVIAKQWNRYVRNVTDGKSDCGVVLNSFNAYLNGINAILQVLPDDK